MSGDITKYSESLRIALKGLKKMDIRMWPGVLRL